MKADDPSQLPLPLNDSNSEAYTTSKVHRKSALYENESTTHRNGRVYSNALERPKTFLLFTNGFPIQRKFILTFSMFRVSTQVGIAK